MFLLRRYRRHVVLQKILSQLQFLFHSAFFIFIFGFFEQFEYITFLGDITEQTDDDGG